MTFLAWLIVLLAAGLAAAYVRASLPVWTGVTGLLLVLMTLHMAPSLGGPLALWVVFLAAAVPLNHRGWRRRYITQPMLRMYEKMTPSLSETERISLEAGTVGFEGELFGGRPNFKRLLGQSKPELTAEEQAFLDGPCEEVCRMVDDWEVTHERADLPPEVWDYLKRQGFFGMIIPKRYGGLEFSAAAHAAVLQKLASRSVTLSSTVGVPNSLGPAELLLHYGTEQQRSYYLPRLASGQELPCFGLTAPTAGSDATAIPDTGVVCKGEVDGEEVLGIRLNFDKRYITLAPVATVIGVAFQLEDPEHLLGDEERPGITLALVPRDTEGVEVGKRHFPLNVPFQNGPVRGHDVFVPLDAIIGGPGQAGQGWRMLVEVLSIGRAISLPSSNTGGAKLATFATGAYSRIRKQFNMPIGHFEGVEEALARIGGYTYAMSATSTATATAVDRGEKPAVSSAIAKYHCTEMARKIVTDAMDIHGGKGIILGPRNYLGRGWQGAPVSITVEGANILTRSMMIFGQGAIRCHPYVLKEMEAARDPDREQRLKRFDKLLFGHIGFAMSNAARSLVLGLTGARFAGGPGEGSMRRYFARITRYSSALALVADTAMLTLGGKLKKKEKLSARLGDCLSQLYIASAVLKQYNDHGRPVADLPLVQWACEDALFKVQTQLAGFLRNFPNRFLAGMLRVLVFPLGTRERAPSDRLGHKVAQLMLTPSETRERLTYGAYLTAEPNNPVGMMNETLKKVLEATPLERRVDKAVRQGLVTAQTPRGRLDEAVERGVVTREEAERLWEIHQEVMEIIAVDEFDEDYLKAGQTAKEPVTTGSTEAA